MNEDFLLNTLKDPLSAKVGDLLADAKALNAGISKITIENGDDPVASVVVILDAVPEMLAAIEKAQNELSQRSPVNDIVLLDPSYEDLKRTPIGQWVTVLHSEFGTGYLNIRGKHCLIALEPLPNYSNRGRFLAKLDVLEEYELHMDWADGWDSGRYYFDLSRAKAEIEDWMRARNQLEEN